MQIKNFEVYQKINESSQPILQQKKFYSISKILKYGKNIAKNILLLSSIYPISANFLKFCSQLKSFCLIKTQSKEICQKMFSFLLSAFETIQKKKQIKLDNFEIQNSQKQELSTLLVSRFKNQLVSERTNNPTLLHSESMVKNALELILKQKIILPNPQCAGCSPVFFKKSEIYANNALYNKIYGISERQINQINLRKIFVALANQGSGILIIGTDQTERNLIEGFYLTKEKNQSLTKRVHLAIQKILPKFYFRLEFVRVHNHFLNQTANPFQEIDRYVCRILVLPYKRNQLHYEHVIRQGFSPLLNFYVFEEKQDYLGSQIVKLHSEAFNDKLYDQILSIFKNRNKYFTNLHYEICETMPFYDISYFSAQKIRNKNFVEQVQKPDEYLYEESLLTFQEDIPTKKYFHEFLLVLSSNKKDGVMNVLRNKLEEKKILFHLQKPYQNSLAKNQKSFWYMSSSLKFDRMKRIITDMMPTAPISYLKIQSSIQLNDTEQLNGKVVQQIEKSLSSLFKGHSFKQQQKMIVNKNSNSNMKCLVLKFQSNNEAILGFMQLERHFYRPLFTKWG